MKSIKKLLALALALAMTAALAACGGPACALPPASACAPVLGGAAGAASFPSGASPCCFCPRGYSVTVKHSTFSLAENSS